MNIAQALLRALKERGAREIFGIPGDFALAFFKVIEESEILPLYCLSHEPAVGFAADAAARTHGGLGVAAVTYGAGAFNLVNSVVAAYAERVPMVVVSGAPGAAERNGSLRVHHQARAMDSQYRIYREITGDQARLDDPATAPSVIARVLKTCRERSLPVYLELPRDRVTAKCRPVPPDEPSTADTAAVAACAEEALDRIASAASPIAMIDVEIRRYGIEARVGELVRKLGLPMVTSFMGRGLLAGSDTPPLGTYLGFAGDEEISRAIEESDALLLLGVLPTDTNFGAPSRPFDLRHAIQALEGQVRIGDRIYDGIPLPAFVEALGARAKPSVNGRAWPKAQVFPRGLVADDQPLHVNDIACAVNDAMRRHGVMPIACDVGDCLFTAFHIDAKHFVAPGVYAGMGYAVPAGLGVQAASGERPLVLVGDGAFQMTGWELGNCRRYGWDPIVIVFNNKSWEMLRVLQPESRFNDLDDWHFADVATALGGATRKVATRRELAEALDRAALERGRFWLVEAMLPRGECSETLSRFAEGIRRARLRK